MRNIVATMAIPFFSACGSGRTPEPTTPSRAATREEADRFGDVMLQEVTPL